MTNKLTVLNSFTMPAEDETFEINVSDTKSLAPNCWLWNESVGYLEVVKYSLYNNIITVKNLGRRENAKKGTEFPTCMEFLTTAPTALDPYNPLSTCLAADFNSPTVGQEAYMSVGSTYVIKVDDQIIVDSDYRYAVTQVVNATTLKVRNEGLGKEGIIEVGCDSCVPVQVVSKLNCCPIPSGDLTSNTSVLTVSNGFDVLLDNASLTLDTDLSKYDNSSSEFITLNDVPRGTLNSSSNLIGVTGGSNNVLGNITLSLDTDLSKYDNTNSNFITVGGIPRGELYSSTNVLTVNNGANNVLSNIELVLDKDLSKYDNTTSGFLSLSDKKNLTSGTSVLTVTNGTGTTLENTSLTLDTDLSKYDNTTSGFFNASDKKNLTSNTSVLTVTNGTGATLENTSLTLDTDLSQYDNTTSGFFNSSDKKNLTSTSPILTVTNGNGATLENTSLTLNTDLSQYDNSVSQFVTAGGLPSGYIISNTSVLSVSGGSGATLTNVSLTLDTDLSQYDNSVSGFITGIANLSDIGDVTLTSPQDGDVLTYDANSGEWINSTVGGGSYLPLAGGTMTGSIRVSGSGFTLGDSTQEWNTVYTDTVKANSNTLRVGGNSSSTLYFVPTATATTNVLGYPTDSWEEAYIDQFNSSSGNTYVTFNTHIWPSGNATENLGGPNNRWKYIYVDTILGGPTGEYASSRIVPENPGTTTLGSSSSKWGTIYCSGSIYLGAGTANGLYFHNDTSHTYIRDVTGNTLYLHATGSTQIGVNGVTHFVFSYADFRPTDGNVNLGGSSKRWKTIYYNGGSLGSDYRLKDNIIDLESGLDIINDLKVKSYTLKNNHENVSYGIIAQEAVVKRPELISIPKDEDDYYGVHTQNIMFAAVRAIQELSSKVDELNAKIKLLEGKL